MTDSNHDINAPHISIIIPNYNQEQYITECIDSMSKQTYTDFEVLIVDDGSTDASVDIIQQEIAGKSQYSLIQQANKGVAAARNTGLRKAKGMWICFIDPDDYVAPEYLQTLLQSAQEYPQAEIIMSTCIAFNAEESKRQHFFPASFVINDESGKRVLYRQLLDGSYAQPADFVTAIGVPWGKIYKRKWLNKNMLHFDERLVRMEDNIFNMRAFHNATQIVYVDYAGYYYRMGGLGNRTYVNMAKGVYRIAIDETEDIMERYGLFNEPILVRAWNDEQVNLYYQELKAVGLTTSGNLSSVSKAVWQRAKDLQERMERVDRRFLSRGAKVKYMMLTNRAMNQIASANFIRQRA